MKDFENIKKDWNTSKKTKSTYVPGDEMLEKVKKNYTEARKLHALNILILALTCVGLAAFFYYVAPLQEAISRIGISLMIGGLLVRIAVEIFSYQKAKKIDYGNSLLKSADQASRFYNWRKKIHGPVTLIIVALYTIGFYILTPEFSRHLSLQWVIIMDVGYLIIMLILYTQIKKGIVREMQHLKKIVEIQHNARID